MSTKDEFPSLLDLMTKNKKAVRSFMNRKALDRQRKQGNFKRRRKKRG